MDASISGAQLPSLQSRVQESACINDSNDSNDSSQLRSSNDCVKRRVRCSSDTSIEGVHTRALTVSFCLNFDMTGRIGFYAWYRYRLVFITK